MNLRDEIGANFTDADGLISPNPCNFYTHNASNNGICYSGEYITLLGLTEGPLTAKDKLQYWTAMTKCEIVPGLMQRSPDNNRDSESPDDMYGLLCGLYFSNFNQFAKNILNYGFKHYGSFDNLNPGHFNWTTMLWRQPQLLAMNLWVSYPGNKFIKILMFPLTIITAVIIATSCIGLDQSTGTDPFRLSWLLVQVAKRESWLCKIASKLWFKRLDNVWGGISGVAKVYYKGLPGKDHPFVAAFAAVDAMK